MTDSQIKNTIRDFTRAINKVYKLKGKKKVLSDIMQKITDISKLIMEATGGTSEIRRTDAEPIQTASRPVTPVTPEPVSSEPPQA